MNKDNGAYNFYSNRMQSACYDKNGSFIELLKCQTKQLTQFGINSSLKSS